MKHITILLSIFLGSLFLSSEVKENKTDLCKENLKGKVKSVHSLTYYAIESNGEVQKGRRTRTNLYEMYTENGYLKEVRSHRAEVGGALNFIRTLSYNDKSELIENINYLPGGKIGYKEDFKYNSKGQIVENNRITEADGYSYKKAYQYDQSGNLLEIVNTQTKATLNTKTVYSYNENNLPIEEITFDYKGNVEFRTVMKYNERNTLIEKWEYLRDGTREHYKFNDKGLPVENYTYYEEGDIYDYKATYKYDANGNSIQYITYEYDGAIHEKSEYKYFYDDQSNWIKQIEYKDEKPYLIYERDIRYYE
ncbi:hypothetical protein [uncultured Roseivirga sp.]|uniref:hypothetical protein n=1 Tax=uncultured Roseivirga sp. TaxID=543088 RepID=UPI0030DB036B|tara:strand:- start:126532 stop:127455 length:924 start_codon:yes stop_codon:yes gene_type:complete